MKICKGGIYIKKGFNITKGGRKMPTPWKCPVCNGTGIVDAGFYNQTSGTWSSTGGEESCRSCTGTGMVWETQPETYVEITRSPCFKDKFRDLREKHHLYIEEENGLWLICTTRCNPPMIAIARTEAEAFRQIKKIISKEKAVKGE